jgi:mono/diheme cytochrome c family protein
MSDRAWQLFVAVVVAVAWVAPSAADDETGITGRGLYMKQCAPCHGNEGRGDGPNAAIFLATPRDLREGFLGAYSTDDLSQRIRDGRPLQLALDVASLKRHSGEVGSIEQHLRRLPSLDWIAVEHGWSVYAERCAACHGPFGRSQGELPKGVRPPRDLGSEEFKKLVDDASLLQAVRHGRKGMPALLPRLHTDEVERVAAFVRVLGPGFEMYSKFCGQCHGDDGVGIGNFDETVGAPAAVFDKEYFVRVDPLRLRESIWHMLNREKPAMPHFRGQLSEAEARRIVDYLRTLPAK